MSKHYRFVIGDSYPTISQAEIVTTDGVFRARVEVQSHAGQPEDDYGYPVLSITHRHNGWHVAATGYGRESIDADGIPVSARHALENFLNWYGYWQGIAVFARWLSIFHGGSIDTWNQGWGVINSTTYLTYDTAKMRNTMDFPFVVPNMNEWIAWLEGEVYGIVLEQAVDYCEHRNELVWDEVDSVWGFYGLQYAEEEASGYLDSLIVDAAIDWVHNHLGTGCPVDAEVHLLN